ncbi:MAG: threonylcarbamoyl-AMP synthase [Verrucomicrobiae bacterium]|nr:threonylcarbamoyl-AMP synthase [Verrucomicrobiae bacterium]
MLTEIAQTDTPEATKAAINRAVLLLQAGEAVALPTETVYGLAADATNPVAVAKIFEAKERPAFDPLIVHLPQRKALPEVATIPDDLESDHARLIENFWPGPLTIVLPKTDAIPDIVTSGLPTVGVRMSDHSVFKQIARALDKPIAAPSANRFGRISPTSASAVAEELDGRIPLIVDGGACARGLESTIIRLEKARGPKPFIHILRAGPITEDDLKKFGKIVRESHNEAVEANAPEAPGMLASHYAPRTPLRLLSAPDEFVPQPGLRYALLSYRGQKKDRYLGLTDWAELLVLSPGSGKLPEAGIRFFHLLRQLDKFENIDEIIAEPVPDRGVGAAIMERLRKAAAGSGV